MLYRIIDEQENQVFKIGNNLKGWKEWVKSNYPVEPK
jgi:hypothetical protein